MIQKIYFSPLCFFFVKTKAQALLLESQQYVAKHFRTQDNTSYWDRKGGTRTHAHARTHARTHARGGSDRVSVSS